MEKINKITVSIFLFIVIFCVFGCEKRKENIEIKDARLQQQALIGEWKFKTQSNIFLNDSVNIFFNGKVDIVSLDSLFLKIAFVFYNREDELIAVGCKTNAKWYWNTLKTKTFDFVSDTCNCQTEYLQPFFESPMSKDICNMFQAESDESEKEEGVRFKLLKFTKDDIVIQIHGKDIKKETNLVLEKME